MAHDSVSRWLARVNVRPAEIWRYVKNLVRPEEGYLIGDDTMLEKQHSDKNEIVSWRYSGNKHCAVKGIPLVNLLWTGGEEFIPVDYCFYQKLKDNKTKNDHFQDMLKRAKKRGFKPRYIMMDSWYSGIENLKLISKDLKWSFICNIACNRVVSPSKGAYCAVSDLDLTKGKVKRVWLKQFGYVLVCIRVDKDGDRTYLITNDLDLTNYDQFLKHWKHRWQVEEFHRGIKQTTGIEKCYSTQTQSQKTHVFASFVAFLKLERQRLQSQISWYEQKALIPRLATASFLASA